MADPHRRREERLPCDLQASLASLSSGAPICSVRVVDLGLGGAAVESPVALHRGVSYELRLREGRYPARVSWEAKPDRATKTLRCGLAFTLTSGQEAQLRPLLDELRHKRWS